MKEKTIALVKKTLQHDLISGSLYVFAGSMIGNFLAFLFNFIIVRNLKSADYGIYASIVSLINLVAIPSQSFITIITQFATEYFAKKQTGKVLQLYLSLFKFTASLGIILFFAFLVFNSQIESFFHFSNIWFLVIAALTIVITYFGIVNSAFMTSLLKFRFLSFIQILTGLIKFGGALVLLLIGYSVSGTLLVIFFSGLLPFICGYFPILPIFKQRTERIKIPLTDIIRYAIPATVVTLVASSFTSSDILLVKHYFLPHQAGIYAGLSLIGRVIFYFTSTIPMVMFPLIIKRYNQKENFTNLLYLSLLMILIPSLGLTIFYFIFPAFTIQFFLGKQYLSGVPYVGFIGIFMTLFSMINLLAMFFLSLKKTAISYIIAAGGLLQIIGIILYHSSFTHVISVNLVVAVLLLGTILVYYFKTYASKTP